MPIYEYKCQKCGDVYEVRQNFSEEALKTHEGCGGTVERLISAPALQFKGSGWYITDYAKGGNSSPAGKNGKNGTESKTETKSDSGTSSSSNSGGTGSSSSSSEKK